MTLAVHPAGPLGRNVRLNQWCGMVQAQEWSADAPASPFERRARLVINGGDQYRLRSMGAAVPDPTCCVPMAGNYRPGASPVFAGNVPVRASR